MQVIIEINEANLKAFPSCEQLVLTSGHLCNCPGNIFLHCIPRHQKSAYYVRRSIPVRLIPVHALLSVQHLRERWRECQSIDDGVAVSDGGDDVISFGDMTSMVAIFAHQQQHPLAVGWLFFKQADGKVYGIANCCSVITHL